MRRSPVYGRACVASSQPLASSAGLQILSLGGNAVDAAIAVAAALAVTEPTSNGIGGDCFALHYSASSKRVSAVHGNGPAPAALTPAAIARDTSPATRRLAPQSSTAITVPGAVAGWGALHKLGAGKLDMRHVLAPAVALARHGFPVAPVTAASWRRAEGLLRAARGGPGVWMPAGRAPGVGEVFRNAALGDTLERIGEEGCLNGFYRGKVAEEIVRCVGEVGGCMSLEDLEAAGVRDDRVRDAICVDFGGSTVWEVGAPTHGGAVLLGLNILEAAAEGEGGVAAVEGGRYGVENIHRLIEAVRLAYLDAGRAIGGDGIDDARFLDKEYAKTVAAGISGGQRRNLAEGGDVGGGGTVQFCVVDKEGNAVSFIQSNYIGFGTGHTPEGCGFSLHNRGLGFVVGAGHPNSAKAGAYPYHTIIPGLVTGPDRSLHAVFGCMGSYMQPQGHILLLSNLLDWGLDSQAAIDALRLRVRGDFGAAEGESGDDVALEKSLGSAQLIAALMERGHVVAGREENVFFGRAQVITRSAKSGIVCGGSDGRADGQAVVL